MTQTEYRPALNGVGVPTLFATLDAVQSTPEIADFQFRARNTWVSGAHNRTTIQGFYGAGQEFTTRVEPFTYDANHPLEHRKVPGSARSAGFTGSRKGPDSRDGLGRPLTEGER